MMTADRLKKENVPTWPLWIMRETSGLRLLVDKCRKSDRKGGLLSTTRSHCSETAKYKIGRGLPFTKRAAGPRYKRGATSRTSSTIDRMTGGSTGPDSSKRNGARPCRAHH